MWCRRKLEMPLDAVMKHYNENEKCIRRIAR